MSNHIHNLTERLHEARAQLTETRIALIELELYLLSSKFAGDGNDYVHVSTDILPRIRALRAAIPLHP